MIPCLKDQRKFNQVKFGVFLSSVNNFQIKFLIVYIFIFVFDRITKHWAITQGLNVINSDLALGINISYSTELHLLSILLVIWLLLSLSAANWIRTLILAGACSNLLDRVLYGGVCDWLPMPIVGGANNLADWAIIIGLIGLIKEIATNKYANKIHATN